MKFLKLLNFKSSVDKLFGICMNLYTQYFKLNINYFVCSGTQDALILKQTRPEFYLNITSGEKNEKISKLFNWIEFFMCF